MPVWLCRCVCLVCAVCMCAVCTYVYLRSSSCTDSQSHDPITQQIASYHCLQASLDERAAGREGTSPPPTGAGSDAPPSFAQLAKHGFAATGELMRLGSDPFCSGSECICMQDALRSLGKLKHALFSLDLTKHLFCCLRSCSSQPGL